MELYNQSDIDLIDKNIDKIIEKIDKEKQKLFKLVDEKEVSPEKPPKAEPVKPSFEDVKDIVDIVLEFVRTKKRKIYGGYAHNHTIKQKNPDDAFYDEKDVPDIDVYSPDPISDLVELCDILHNKGYKDVVGKEALHEETYKIFAKNYNAIDLSYVPKNVYNYIPFIEIEGVRYIHPSFAMIDLYKMVTEPFFSSFRWKKTFPRLSMLQKHFPFNKPTRPVPQNVYRTGTANALNVILDFVKNNTNVYLFGAFAYNRMLELAEPNEKQITVPFYEFVSIDYANDVKGLVKKLSDAGIKTDMTEYYPFWHFYDYNAEITHNGVVIAKIYRHLKRCTPVKEITYEKATVQLACFDFVLLMEMVAAFRMKTKQQSDKVNYHNIMISQLVSMRNAYLKANKKTMLDDTLFQSMVTTCIGATVDPQVEAHEKRKKKKALGKAMMFKYIPVHKLENRWVFANTSGNVVNNPKNLKVK